MMQATFKKQHEKLGNVPADYLDWHSKQEYYTGRQIIINGEIKLNRQGRFRYTKIMYSSPNNLHYEEVQGSDNEELRHAIP